ncbi:MAG: class I SAM-dependent methyltransferase [Ectothiorhodospiraceae bacterium]|nr:class I SAM-dependent methyltransferase [Chromatiales bacterium]MCP5157374.1 class I SAM-dependent methyltransferase [Ectothiorhodospiraceae bacterium]
MDEHERFRRFERDGWSEVASRYHGSFGALTAQATEPLLARAGVEQGARVLDLACGTGLLAAGALARGAVVTGVDLVPAMIDEARARVPAARFETADAERLPYDDGAFDVVVCGFGVLHFPRPELVAVEVHRVLAAGGRFAFSAWRPPEHSPYLALVGEALRRHGRLDAPLPPGPPPYRLGNEDAAIALLVDAGFAEPHTMEVPVIVRLSDATDVLAPLLEGGVRSRKVLEAQTPEALALVHADAARAAQSFRVGDRFEIPRPALIASGVRRG